MHIAYRLLGGRGGAVLVVWCRVMDRRRCRNVERGVISVEGGEYALWINDQRFLVFESLGRVGVRHCRSVQESLSIQLSKGLILDQRFVVPFEDPVIFWHNLGLNAL